MLSIPPSPAAEQAAGSTGAPAWVAIAALIVSGLSFIAAATAVIVTYRNFRASDPRVKIRVQGLKHEDGNVILDLRVVNSGRLDTFVGPFYLQYPRGFGISRREISDLAAVDGPSSSGWASDGGTLKGAGKVTCKAFVNHHARRFGEARRVRPYYLPGSRVRVVAELGTGKVVRSWKVRLTPRMLLKVDRARTAYEATQTKEPTWQEEMGLPPAKVLKPKRPYVNVMDTIVFSLLYLVIIGLGVTAFTVLT